MSVRPPFSKIHHVLSKFNITYQVDYRQYFWGHNYLKMFIFQCIYDRTHPDFGHIHFCQLSERLRCLFITLTETKFVTQNRGGGLLTLICAIYTSVYTISCDKFFLVGIWRGIFQKADKNVYAQNLDEK